MEKVEFFNIIEKDLDFIMNFIESIMNYEKIL